MNNIEMIPLWLVPHAFSRYDVFALASIPLLTTIMSTYSHEA
jgi:hypothetical protein